MRGTDQTEPPTFLFLLGTREAIPQPPLELGCGSVACLVTEADVTDVAWPEASSPSLPRSSAVGTADGG